MCPTTRRICDAKEMSLCKVKDLREAEASRHPVFRLASPTAAEQPGEG